MLRPTQLLALLALAACGPDADLNATDSPPSDATSSSLSAESFITASPRNLVAASGTPATATIRWDTHGKGVGQVYVQTRGGPRALFASGTSGAQTAPWIQPGAPYVFELFVGSTLQAWTSVTAHAGPASQFGFNYWPEGFSCTALDNAHWSTLRPVVARDLDHMVSLGARVVRLMYWPQVSGFEVRGNKQGARFTSRFQEQRANTVDLLGLARERGLKVIIAFGNNYFDLGNGTAGHRWWMDSYSDFAPFLADTVTWANGFIDSIEASSVRDTVLFYDSENEYNKDHPYAGWYATVMYDWTRAPRGKRGFSVLRVPEDSDDLKLQLAQGAPREAVPRRLDYADFHSYPAYPHLPNIEVAFDRLTSRFPDSTVIMGEFGRTAANGAEEAAQQSTVLDLVNRAVAKRIPYFMNWMFWDKTPGSSPTGTALGYGMNTPKDALGGLVSRLGLIGNGDFEVSTGASCWGCASPVGWTAGGSAGVTFFAGGPSASDAATNQWYARVQTQTHPSSAWIVSNLTPAQGGQHLYANAFVRASMNNVRMTVTEYDAAHHVVRQSAGPAANLAGWSFVNYLQAAATSWSVTLRPETRFIIVGIVGESRAPGSILDVDAVSVSAL